jgi:hypothetical protein
VGWIQRVSLFQNAERLGDKDGTGFRVFREVRESDRNDVNDVNPDDNPNFWIGWAKDF